MPVYLSGNALNGKRRLDSTVEFANKLIFKLTRHSWNAQVIVTSAVGAQLGSDVSGARIVQVLDSEIRHDYYAIEDLPQTIDLSSLKS